MQFSPFLYTRSSLYLCEQVLLDHSSEMFKDGGHKAWWDDLKFAELNLCGQGGLELQCWDLSWHGEGSAYIDTWYGWGEPIIKSTDLLVRGSERSKRLLHKIAHWEMSPENLWWQKTHHAFCSKAQNLSYGAIWRKYDIELEVKWSLLLWNSFASCCHD